MSLVRLQLMDSLERLVVGADDSAASSAAVAWACRYLKADGVLHVVHAFTPVAELALAALQVDWVPLRDQARNDLEGPWTEPARASNRAFKAHLVEDDPADALMHTAQVVDASAIVVGAHGPTLANRHMLGSVTKKLLHHAEVPVVVVHPDAAEIEPAGSIVACVGYGKAGDATAHWAASVAAASGRPLTLLHALSNRPFFPKDSPLETLSSHLGPDVAMEWVQENLDRLVADFEVLFPDVVVSTKIAKGSATDAIMNAGAGAELVVLGNGVSSIIGPRSQHILTFGRFTTAVVPT